MKGTELVKLLKKNGWHVDRIHGSHFIMKKGKQDRSHSGSQYRHSRRTSDSHKKENRTIINSVLIQEQIS